jgi:hypothetical protein
MKTRQYIQDNGYVMETDVELLATPYTLNITTRRTKNHLTTIAFCYVRYENHCHHRPNDDFYIRLTTFRLVASKENVEKSHQSAIKQIKQICKMATGFYYHPDYTKSHKVKISP